MSPQIDLERFVGWVRESIQGISDVYREIEEVQQRFNGSYSDLLADWQGRVETAAGQLATATDLPASIAEPLAAKRAEERTKLEARVAELQGQVKERKAVANQALADGQAQLAKLQDLNPLLNRREEALKEDSLHEMEVIADLEKQLKSVGVLARTFGQGELKTKLQKAREKHDATLANLAAVREQWVQKKKEAAERQTELRTAWQEATVAASQAQSELDYLTENTDSLEATRGAQAYLTELSQAPEVGGDLQPVLAKIAEQNKELADYRAGLASVAEALGLLIGIRTGMERFYASADKVYEEQRQFSLKKLRLDVPKETIQFHNVWSEFAKRVRDDKYLAQHPLEFAKIVNEYIQGRFSGQAIEAMFESLGTALNDATQAWK